LARPQHLAVGRVETLQRVGGGDEELHLALDLRQDGRAVREVHFGPFLLPLHLPGRAIEGQEPRLFLHLVALQQNRVLVEHRTATDGDVERIRRDFLAPGELAVVVERGQHGRTEQHVHAFAVGGRRRRRIAAAQIRQLPRAGLYGHVPKKGTVIRPVAGGVVLGEFLLLNTGRPVAHGYEDPTPLHDRAGLILILLVYGLAAGQRLLPEHVFLVLTAPG